MKTTQKHGAIVVLSIVMTVIWPSSELNATEEMKGEDIGVREAIRKMELQDENGQIHQMPCLMPMRRRKPCPFFLKPGASLCLLRKPRRELRAGVGFQLGQATSAVEFVRFSLDRLIRLTLKLTEPCGLAE